MYWQHPPARDTPNIHTHTHTPVVGQAKFISHFREGRTLGHLSKRLFVRLIRSEFVNSELIRDQVLGGALLWHGYCQKAEVISWLVICKEGRIGSVRLFLWLGQCPQFCLCSHMIMQ